ncbi:hypothetical protein [Bacillus thuringiensis]|uniref:hypothetical protein n=1 Tax=Bacillus thuringiensis TaxID=1428 RepID=UPI002E174F63|nr:hypothetical protein [Bacillus thuringiensis]
MNLTNTWEDLIYYPLLLVQGHENGYFLDKKVDTSVFIIVFGQENNNKRIFFIGN